MNELETIQALCDVIENLLEHIQDETFRKEQEKIYREIVGDEYD